MTVISKVCRRAKKTKRTREGDILLETDAGPRSFTECDKVLVSHGIGSHPSFRKELLGFGEDPFVVVEGPGGHGDEGLVCLRSVMLSLLTGDVRKVKRDTYTVSQVMTAAVGALRRDLAGQYPGKGRRKSKDFLDAGSLVLPKD